jgi:hypothetical protein
MERAARESGVRRPPRKVPEEAGVGQAAPRLFPFGGADGLAVHNRPARIERQPAQKRHPFEHPRRRAAP